jgi:hypothetical protein
VNPFEYGLIRMDVKRPAELSTLREENAGHASGWNVWPSWNGRWQWSSFAPGGGNIGTATTRDEAERLAQTSLEHLKQLPTGR